MNWVLILVIFNSGPQLHQINFQNEKICESARLDINRLVGGMGYTVNSKCFRVANSDVWDQDFDNRPFNRK